MLAKRYELEAHASESCYSAANDVCKLSYVAYETKCESFGGISEDKKSMDQEHSESFLLAKLNLEERPTDLLHILPPALDLQQWLDGYPIVCALTHGV